MSTWIRQFIQQSLRRSVTLLGSRTGPRVNCPRRAHSGGRRRANRHSRSRCGSCSCVSSRLKTRLVRPNRDWVRLANPIVFHGTTVAPEELWSAVAAIDRSAEYLRQAWRLSYAAAGVLPHLTHEIRLAIERACELRSQLEQCISEYTAVEEANLKRAQTAASVAHWMAGFAAHFGQFVPAALLAGGTLSNVDWLRRDRFARAIRLEIESADDALLGLGLIPWFARRPGAVSWLGQHAAQLTDSDQRVSLSASASRPVGAPTDLSELVDRIPTASAQVRVESYPTPTSTNWIVYIAGTRTPKLSGPEPFDMRSNLAEVGGAPAASQAAVEQAMTQAGVRPGDRVVLVGHSQGGMVAARIAESGRYRVVECVTAGAPLGTIASAVPTLAIEHRQDVIPALAGATEPSASRVTYVTDAPPNAERSFIGPHQLREYQQTATAVDRSTDPAIVETRARLRTFATGTGTVSEFTATRRGN